MKTIYAIATLSGTIIGAGLFALPYITLKLGFWVILGYFLILGGFITLIHLFFGELALKTPDFKRLPGFAKLYLGRKGQITAYISTILSIFGALLAYLILGGEFLTELLEPVLGGNTLFYTVFYFIVAAAVIFHGIKAVAKVEFWGLILFFVILFAIFFRGESLITTDNLFASPDWSLLFLPYGVILFSLWGATLIPEIEEMLGEKRKVIFEEKSDKKIDNKFVDKSCQKDSQQGTNKLVFINFPGRETGKKRSAHLCQGKKTNCRSKKNILK